MPGSKARVVFLADMEAGLWGCLFRRLWGPEKAVAEWAVTRWLLAPLVSSSLRGRAPLGSA